ncbi:MAG: SDR family oxidoreductase [Gemmatimonadaceae bacterium]|nr:SDR family oxidoreductase [Gemmatimonadaceae bacterium]
MSTILVIGASGTVGRALAPALEVAGHTVRRATSQAAGPGQVHLNLLTGEGLTAALAGVDAAFLMSPPGHTNQDVLLSPVIDAAKRAGVRKLVLMTAMGADADPNGPMRKLELHLEQSGVTWNVIRPNWFMQNFNTFWIHGIRTANAIQLPTGTAKGSFIDARDIADVAAVLLTSSTHDNQAFDLTGGEAIDHATVAEHLTRALGRTIRYDDITPDVMRPGLLAAGLPADYTEFLLVILHYFKLGAAERVTDAVPTIAGHAPRTFAAYANDYRAAFG